MVLVDILKFKPEYYDRRQQLGGRTTLQLFMKRLSKAWLVLYSDMYSESWLPSGRSILFSVPREQMVGNFTIYLSFNYEWEYGERTFRPDEPQHRVYFRASDLSAQLQNIKHRPVPRQNKLQQMVRLTPSF
jgi:hypothetical protein